ncbi:MAG TPA: inorganic phosphate transporter [Polyangiales bacterium]|jgi:PiT family inorganic phosphate transporter|nr:inorganic phosphate transporter [Polyangiales bacterium]
MDHQLILVSVVVLIALAFDFINGFHDAANSIATIVSTQVLTPRVAVAFAAVLNFVAFLIFPLHVAGTIGKGIIDPSIVNLAVITGALVGAIIWNLATWWWGLPSSSSHALVGGLIGAGVAKGGTGVLGTTKIIETAAFIVISPVVGMVMSAALTVALAWLLRRSSPGKVDQWFRRLQLLSAGAFSLNHGGNDAQKTMGIIAVLLYSQGYLGKEFPKGDEIPFWIVLSCHAAMGLGTLSGGWRIVKTMGLRLTKLKPFGGFCAETGGSVAIFMATVLGVPVSTTHTITGAIVGVGAVNRPGSVRWGIAARILWAWVFTIPISAALSVATYHVLVLLGL